MRLVWSPRSLRHLEALHAYIADRNPDAATRVVSRIVHRVERQLSLAPNSGRPGRVDGTRELVVPRTPFIVAYSVEVDRVEIVAVIHGAMRWPKRL